MPSRRRFLSLSAKAAAAPILLLAGCQAGTPPAPSATPVPPTPTDTPIPPSATPAPPTATPVPSLALEIDGFDLRQNLREVGGGNFVHFFGGVTSALDPVSTLNIETLDPRVVRVRMDLQEWQPEEGGEFVAGPHVQATFDFLREYKKRAPDGLVVASIWQVPDWMVTNPEAQEPRFLKEGYQEKIVAAIGGWLLRARDEYGVEVDYTAFNEPNLGVTVKLTPEEQVRMIGQGGPQLQALGLKTRWLLGDTSNMASFTYYIPPIWAEERLRPYLGPLCFHSWDAGVPDETLQSIGRFALENELEVWCTEAGFDAAEWKTPEEFPTWRHAMRLAAIYTRVLRDTRCTSMFYWQMMGKDYNINDGQTPFPALVYLDQLKRHFPAGAQVVGTPGDPARTIILSALAARTPDGGFSVALINQARSPRAAAVSGLPDGPYTVTTITEADGMQASGQVIAVDGQAVVELPGQSLAFLKLG